jgi:hypothetical protein
LAAHFHQPLSEIKGLTVWQFNALGKKMNSDRKRENEHE